MSLSHSPQIVTNGLVLHFDAANQKSYTTSASTVWNNLVVVGNSGSIINNLTYTASNLGALKFTTTASTYVDFFAPNLNASVTTVEMWAKLGAAYSGRMMFGWYAYDVFSVSNGIGFNTGGGDMYGIPSSSFALYNPTSSWVHYIFEMRADVSYVNNKIYLNSQQQTLSQVAGNQVNSNRNFNSGNGRIGVWKVDTAYIMNMDCAVFKVYNKALTQAEVNQNFNALRGRYGL